MKLYKYSLNAAAGLAGLAAMSGGAAHANSVDYGSLEQLFNEPVTTSATGAPQRVTEAPVNMTIITQDQIRESGAQNIPSVLERLPQVDVNWSSSGDADVSIRGYNQPYAPRLLVLVNGRQVYLDHYGFTNWNLIPVQMSEIRQIEVVSGPNTALFGFNAVSGVVNIVTYDPLRDNIGNASVTVGTQNFNGESATLTHQINPNVGLRVSGSVEQGDGWDDENDYAQAQHMTGSPGVDTSKVNAQLAVQFSPKLRGELEVSAAHDNRLEETSATTYDRSEFNTTGIRAGLSADTSAGMIDGQIYHNTLSQDLVTSSGLTPLQNNITVGSVSLTSRIGTANTVRIAGEYRHNVLNEVGHAAHVTYDVFSLSGMWNWAITDTLASTVAIRLDHLDLSRDGPQVGAVAYTNDDFDTDMDEPSLNAGLVWRASGDDTFRFTVARGVQSPSLLEYGTEVDATFLHLVGNPNIKPTIVDNVELGWDRKISPLNALFRASLYWQKNEDLKFGFVDLTIASPMVLKSGNFGDSELVGLDLSLEGKAGAYDWRVSYSHRDISDDFRPGNVSLPFNFEQTSPADVATAGLTWTGGKLELGGDVRYVSDSASAYQTAFLQPYHFVAIDAYTLLNARAAWNFNDHMSIAVSGRNLLDEAASTTSGLPMDRSFWVSLSTNF